MLRPNTLALTALLALLTSLGPLSTDMYLPSLPAIVAALGATVPEGQLTLSVFLAGFAVGMLVYGSIADRYGRKPLLVVGLCLFLTGTLACVLAPSIGTLIAGRFVQALGGCGPVILARSIVRDLYVGARAGQELARMGAFMGFIPAIAPTIGGVLEAIFGWQSSFVAIGVVGTVILLAVVFRLPETLPAAGPPVSVRAVAASFAVVGRDGGFRANVAIVCAAYGGLFAYISGSSFVLQGGYGMGPVAFGVAFGLGALSYVCGSLYGQRAVVRVGIDRVLGLGAAINAGAGALMLAGVLFGPGHPAELVVPMMLYLGGIGLTLPQATAGAIMPFAARAGAASSLLGFLQMTAGAVVGVAIGHLVEDAGPLPLALFIACLGVATLVAYRVTREVRRRSLAG